MAVARDLADGDNAVIAVIGDGAMSAGMAYEAMNNAGALHSRLIVILNDNDMSIAPPTGAMSAYLARLVSSHAYRSLRDAAKQLARRLPKFFYDKAKRTEEYGRGFWTGGTLFEELGFFYVGPIDGHNLDHLLPILKNVRDMPHGPVLVHVVTKKGKGYPPAEAADDKYHGVSAFDVVTGAQAKPKSNAPTYTSVFAEALVAEGGARRQDRRHHRRHADTAPASIASPKPTPSERSTSASPSSTPSPSRRASPAKATSRSARSTRPSCSAPTIRSCTTWRSRTCPCASPSIAPGWSARTARPTPARSTSPISPACPT